MEHETSNIFYFMVELVKEMTLSSRIRARKKN